MYALQPCRAGESEKKNRAAVGRGARCDNCCGKEREWENGGVVGPTETASLRWRPAVAGWLAISSLPCRGAAAGVVDAGPRCVLLAGPVLIVISPRRMHVPFFACDAAAAPAGLSRKPLRPWSRSGRSPLASVDVHAGGSSRAPCCPSHARVSMCMSDESTDPSMAMANYWWSRWYSRAAVGMHVVLVTNLVRLPF